MISLTSYLRTTIGQKKLMGLSGLALSGFLLSHMLGNLLLYVGPEAYNQYSYKLISNPLIEFAEAGLVLMTVIHIGIAIALTRRNKSARPVGYAASPHGEKRTRLASKTLILSGLLLFTFIVLHLITFKYGTVYTVKYDGVEMRDLYTLVVEKFHQPGYIAWYLFSLVILGMHLSHGVSASFQSLGVLSANNPTLKKIGWFFALVIAGGFISQPLFIWLAR